MAFIFNVIKGLSQNTTKLHISCQSIFESKLSICSCIPSLYIFYDNLDNGQAIYFPSPLWFAECKKFPNNLIFAPFCYLNKSPIRDWRGSTFDSHIIYSLSCRNIDLYMALINNTNLMRIDDNFNAILKYILKRWLWNNSIIVY